MNLCSFMQCVHLGLDQTLRGLAGSGRLVDREVRAALGGERLALPSGPALAQLQPAIRAARLTFSVSATATKWRRWRSSCTPSSAETATESPLPNQPLRRRVTRLRRGGPGWLGGPCRRRPEGRCSWFGAVLVPVAGAAGTGHVLRPRRRRVARRDWPLAQWAKAAGKAWCGNGLP
jgi:hypothetical protein